MPKVKQLTISCDNAPGSLARVASIIAGAKVNILALNATASGAMGYIQFVVDHGAKAKKALKREGYSCYEEVVLHTTLPNVPGALAQFVKKLPPRTLTSAPAIRLRWKIRRTRASCLRFPAWRVQL